VRKEERRFVSRYEPLSRYLESRRTDEAPLTFRDVEAILSRSLPRSARLHQPWWSNTTTHSHAYAWMRVGWKTSRVDLAGERLVFVRAAARPAEDPPAVAPAPPTSARFSIGIDDLSASAHALLERHAMEHACSFSRAAAELLNEAAIDRKRRLLDRFPLTGERSSVDSVDLIREDRDAR
jgi:hypothetical protein